MKKLAILAIILALGSGAVFAARADFLGDLYVVGQWRYKMTVEVETPEGIKTGYAVREVSNDTSSVRLNLPQGTNPAEIKGEAVVVDLGERGILFALLSGYKRGADYGYSVLYDVFPSGSGGATAQGIRYYRSLKDAKAALQPADYPKFVRFRDINDPKTVENLLEMESDGRYPATFTIKKDHFAEAFGEGVKLRSVTIEMTDEPVTRGIVGKYMPSYSPQEEYLKWLRTLPYGDLRAINANDFGSIRGAK